MYPQPLSFVMMFCDTGEVTELALVDAPALLLLLVTLCLLGVRAGESDSVLGSSQCQIRGGARLPPRFTTPSPATGSQTLCSEDNRIHSLTPEV